MIAVAIMLLAGGDCVRLAQLSFCDARNAKRPFGVSAVPVAQRINRKRRGNQWRRPKHQIMTATRNNYEPLWERYSFATGQGVIIKEMPQIIFATATTGTRISNANQCRDGLDQSQLAD